jgi:glucose-6-phosphate-specific signal transduction histidine kinase
LKTSYQYNIVHRKNHPEVRRKERAAYYRPTKEMTKNRHSPWTREEEKLITAEDRPIDRVLAKQIGRTIAAIQTRRTLIKNASSLP